MDKDNEQCVDGAKDKVENNPNVKAEVSAKKAYDKDDMVNTRDNGAAENQSLGAQPLFSASEPIAPEEPHDPSSRQEQTTNIKAGDEGDAFNNVGRDATIQRNTTHLNFVGEDAAKIFDQFTSGAKKEDQPLFIKEKFRKYDFINDRSRYLSFNDIDYHLEKLCQNLIYHVVSCDYDCCWEAARTLISQSKSLQGDVRIFQTGSIHADEDAIRRLDLHTIAVALADVSSSGCTLIIDVDEDYANFFRPAQWNSTKQAIKTSLTEGRSNSEQHGHIIVLMSKKSWGIACDNLRNDPPECWEVDYLQPMLMKTFDDRDRAAALAEIIQGQFDEGLWGDDTDEQRYTKLKDQLNTTLPINEMEEKLKDRKNSDRTNGVGLPIDQEGDDKLALLAIFAVAFFPGLGITAFRGLIDLLMVETEVKIDARELAIEDPQDQVDNSTPEKDKADTPSRSWVKIPAKERWDIRGDSILAQHGIIAKSGVNGSRTIDFENISAAAAFRHGFEEQKSTFVENQVRLLVDENKILLLQQTPEVVNATIEFLWRTAQRDKGRETIVMIRLAMYLCHIIAMHSIDEASYEFFSISGDQVSLRKAEKRGNSLISDLQKRCSYQAVAKLTNLIAAEPAVSESSFVKFLQSVFRHMIAPFDGPSIDRPENADQLRRYYRETLRFVCIGLAKRLGINRSQLRLPHWFKRICAEAGGEEVEVLRRFLAKYAQNGPEQTYDVIKMTAGWLIKENAEDEEIDEMQAQLDPEHTCRSDKVLSALEWVAAGIFRDLVMDADDGAIGRWPPRNLFLANMNNDKKNEENVARYLIFWLLHQSFEVFIIKEIFGIEQDVFELEEMVAQRHTAFSTVSKTEITGYGPPKEVARKELWGVHAVLLLHWGVLLRGDSRDPKTPQGQEAWETILRTLNQIFEKQPAVRQIWRVHIDNWIIEASALADKDMLPKAERRRFIALIRAGRNALRHLKRPSSKCR